jgi:hypothetical protein
MKHIHLLSIAGLLLAGMVTGASAQNAAGQNESLGDVARTIRSEKKPDTSKHFDNDNLPTGADLSVVGNAGNNPPAASDAAPAASAQTQQPSSSDLKNQIADQQSKIDLLSRELTVAQKEYQLRAAAFYADAGNRLRNAGSWDKEDANYKEQIAQKQKDLDAAQQQLADLQEQARKAGTEANK